MGSLFAVESQVLSKPIAQAQRDDKSLINDVLKLSIRSTNGVGRVSCSAGFGPAGTNSFASGNYQYKTPSLTEVQRWPAQQPSDVIPTINEDDDGTPDLNQPAAVVGCSEVPMRWRRPLLCGTKNKVSVSRFFSEF
jgi:hypothetical protein